MDPPQVHDPGVTCHYREGTSLVSLNLDIMALTDRHDATYLASVLKDVCDKWQISRSAVVGVTTDGGSKESSQGCLRVGETRVVPSTFGPVSAEQIRQ